MLAHTAQHFCTCALHLYIGLLYAAPTAFIVQLSLALGISIRMEIPLIEEISCIMLIIYDSMHGVYGDDSYNVCRVHMKKGYKMGGDNARERVGYNLMRI